MQRLSAYQFPVQNLLVAPDWNCRESSKKLDEHILELKQSIISLGVRQPLKAYRPEKDNPLVPDHLDYSECAIITDGHNRLKATLLAIEEGHPIVALPVILEDRYANKVDHLFTQLTSNMGLPLSPLEKGLAYKKLLAYGVSKEDISTKHGCSIAWIDSCLILTSANPETIKLVTSGDISATTVVGLVRDVGADRAEEIVNETVEQAKLSGKRATGKFANSIKERLFEEGEDNQEEKNSYIENLRHIQWENYSLSTLKKIEKLLYN